MKIFKNFISRLNNYFKNKKLTTKFILLYIILIVVPVTILSLYAFKSLENAFISQLKLNLNHSTESVISEIQTNMETMDKMTRFTSDKEKFKQFILENENIKVEDLIFFYNYYVNDIARTVNVNHKIFSNRIFLQNTNYLEQWPIIYNEDRLRNETWPNELKDDKNDFIWKINFNETKIPYSNEDNKKLIGLFKELRVGNVHLGYIETTMEMSIFCPQMYNNINSDQLLLFYDNKQNKFYYNESNNFLLPQNDLNQILSEIQKNNQETTKNMVMDFKKDKLYFKYEYIKSLDSYLINVVTAKPTIASFTNQRNLFIAFIILIVIVLCIFTYKIVYILLKNLELIIRATRQVSAGNLNPVIDVTGNDEAGELATHITNMLNQIHELMLSTLRNQEMTKNAEIKALQTQINAHFIYNTLESIRMMAEIEDNLEISDSISALGKLIRYSMSWKSPLVNLKDELMYVRNYVKLLNVRHDYQITLVTKIQENLENYKILKMTIQPLIENAVQYGIDPFQTDGVIKISAYESNDKVIIEVSDTGAGMEDDILLELNNNLDFDGIINSTSGSGIGLKNISDRIKSYYGSSYGIEIFSKKNCYTKVRLYLPKNNF